MKYIPLLFVLIAGCSASTNQLHANAMGCKGDLVIESNGIFRDPTEQEKSEQCKPFWDAYNKRLDSITKREREKEIKQANACPRGTTKWCSGSATRINNNNKKQRCSCVRNPESRRRLEGVWF